MFWWIFLIAPWEVGLWDIFFGGENKDPKFFIFLCDGIGVCTTQKVEFHMKSFFFQDAKKRNLCFFLSYIPTITPPTLGHDRFVFKSD